MKIEDKLKKLEDKLISQMDFTLIKENGFYKLTNFKSFFCLKLFDKYITAKHGSIKSIESIMLNINIPWHKFDTLYYQGKEFAYLMKKYNGEIIDNSQYVFNIDNFSSTYVYRNKKY